MDAYTLIDAQKPPTRAALLLSDIKPLYAYILASTDIPAYQIGVSFPSSCLIGDPLPSTTVTRAVRSHSHPSFCPNLALLKLRMHVASRLKPRLHPTFKNVLHLGM